MAILIFGCASPPPGASSIAPSPPAAGPRFAASGPNAEDYRESVGYLMGDRATFNQIPQLVGSHSHLDQIFEGPLVRKATAPSRLARAASEPAIAWEFQGETRTLDDYLARNPTTGLLIARDETIFVERYQYGRNDRQTCARATSRPPPRGATTASRCSRWPWDKNGHPRARRSQICRSAYREASPRLSARKSASLQSECAPSSGRRAVIGCRSAPRHSCYRVLSTSSSGHSYD